MIRDETKLKNLNGMLQNSIQTDRVLKGKNSVANVFSLKNKTIFFLFFYTSFIEINP